MAAPITLTKPQFLATAAAKNPGATYEKYLSYVANARAAKLGSTPSAPADPYSAIIASEPQPLTQPQITTDANQEISPIIAAITAQIEKGTANATHAIGGFSSDAAAKLGAMDFAAPYTSGEGDQAAVDAALRASLAGAGSADADALASRLGVINDPSVAAAASAVGANGAASGRTQMAQGSAALSNLIANAAAAGDYGQKLPGIARLAGLQDIASAQQTGDANIATQTQQVESELPSIIQNLQSQSDSRANAITSTKENQTARNDALASTAATNATKVSVATIAAKTTASEDEIKLAQSDREYRLQFAKTFGVDPVTGKAIPGFTTNAGGRVVKVGTAKTAAAAGTKPPTANEINTWVSAFKDGKPISVTVKAPKPDANGNPVYRTIKKSTGALGYQQAYDRLTSLGVGDQQARQSLDTVYARGEQGRGWLTNEEQATLAQAKLPPAAYRYKGVGYIDPKQAAVLKADGKMPPGKWIPGSTATKDLGPIYVIDESFD